MLRLAWRDLRGGGRFLWVFWCSLVLGVALVAAGGGMFKQVSDGLLADTRELFGGDFVVDSRAPLGKGEREWLSQRASVSLLIELRTMMLAGDRPQLVELQSVDAAYPLYGEVRLDPPISLEQAVSARAGPDGAVTFGAAIDPILAQRLELQVGDSVQIGALTLSVRALIERQPDRSLNANWRGAPVIIGEAALMGSGLVVPASRLDYKYRVKTSGNAAALAESFARSFPGTEFEVRTMLARRGRIAQVLGQVGSALMLLAFSALFVGGLGVANSVRAHLEARLSTIATLGAIGLRQRRITATYLLQIAMLAASASLVGAVVGGALAAVGGRVIAARLPVAGELAGSLPVLIGAWVFGVLIAVTFALPALGRALAVEPAALFRGLNASLLRVPRQWWWWTGAGAIAVMGSLVLALPQPWIGLVYVLAVLLLLALLEGIVRLVRMTALRLSQSSAAGGSFEVRLALSNLYRVGAPLRVTLLSLGPALTVLVASGVVVGALLQTIEQTIPKRAPALVFYDVSVPQTLALREMLGRAETLEEVKLAPLVLGRLSHVNGEALAESENAERALESRDEHKLTSGSAGVDDVTVTRGAWWPEGYRGPPLVAFEDREADQLGLAVGDRLRFVLLGSSIEARLAAIYSQRGIGTRFWFEGMFSDDVLEPFITRYVGTAYLAPEEAQAKEVEIARVMPNIVTVRTERILREARAMLDRASLGLSLIGLVTLLASALVLASVIAASRARQVYDATVLHVLGARLAQVRRALVYEYLLIAGLTAAFAAVFGCALAAGLLTFRLDLTEHSAWWLGVAIAVVLSIGPLYAGAVYLMRTLRLNPAVLLRTT